MNNENQRTDGRPDPGDGKTQRSVPALPDVLANDRKRYQRLRYILFGVAGALVLLVAAGVFVLSRGPIPVNGIAERLETLANDRLGKNGAVRFSGGEFEWLSFSEGIALRLKEPVIDLPQAREPITAGEVDLVFAPFNLFRGGGARPYGVILRKALIDVDVGEPKIAAVEAESAPPSIAPDKPAGDATADAEPAGADFPETVPLPPRRNPPPEAPSVLTGAPPAGDVVVGASGDVANTGLAVIRSLEAATAEMAARIAGGIADLEGIGIKRVEVIDAEVTIRRGSRPAWAFEGLETVLTAGVDPLIEAQATLDQGRFRAPVKVRAQLRSDGTPVSAAFEIDAFDPATQFSAVALPIHLETPVGIAWRLDFNDAAGLAAADLELSLGRGIIGDKQWPERRLPIDGARLSVSFDPATGDIDIGELSLDAETISFNAAGKLARWHGDPSGRQMRLTLDADNLILSDPDHDGPVRFEQTSIDGIVDPAARFALINRVALVSGRADVAMTAEVSWAPKSARFAMVGAFSEMTMSELRHIWLPPISPGARSWFRTNIKSGTVKPGTFSMVFTPQSLRKADEPAIRTTLRTGYRDATLTYFRDLAPLTVADGTMRIDSSEMATDFEGGAVPLPSGRSVAIKEGRVTMSGLGLGDPSVNVTLASAGAADSYVDYVNDSFLGDIVSLGFGADDVMGSAEASLDLSMVASVDPNARNVDYRVAAKIADFASEAVVPDRALSDGTLDMRITRTEVGITGTVAVDGNPSEVDYLRPFDGSGQALSVVTRLDADGRAAFGLDLSSFVEGETSVSLETVDEDKARSRVVVDLTDASVDIELLGWSKPAGRPARLSFLAPTAEAPRRLEEFELAGGSLRLAGTLVVSDEDGIVEADLSAFSVSKGDGATARMVRAANGRYDISVNAKRFDVRRFIEIALAAEPDPASPGFDLAVNAGSVSGYNATSITGLTLNLSQTGGRLTSVRLSGQINGRWPVTGKGAGTPASPVAVDTPEGGGLMRFLNIYRWADGGAMTFRATIAGDGAGAVWSGVVKMDDFNVKGDQLLDDYFLRAPARSASRRERARDTSAIASQVKPDSVAFSKLRIDFRQEGGQLIVTDGVVKGPVVGATFRGALVNATSAVDFTGTFVPAYGINNAFSQVPVIGRILGGDRNEGLFGLTFRVLGTTKEPDVEVNAISAIAPGIFRKIFEYDPPT